MVYLVLGSLFKNVGNDLRINLTHMVINCSEEPSFPKLRMVEWKEHHLTKQSGQPDSKEYEHERLFETDTTSIKKIRCGKIYKMQS